MYDIPNDLGELHSAAPVLERRALCFGISFKHKCLGNFGSQRPRLIHHTFGRKRLGTRDSMDWAPIYFKDLTCLRILAE